MLLIGGQRSLFCSTLCAAMHATCSLHGTVLGIDHQGLHLYWYSRSCRWPGVKQPRVREQLFLIDLSPNKRCSHNSKTTISIFHRDERGRTVCRVQKVLLSNSRSSTASGREQTALWYCRMPSHEASMHLHVGTGIGCPTKWEFSTPTLSYAWIQWVSMMACLSGRVNVG